MKNLHTIEKTLYFTNQRAKLSGYILDIRHYGKDIMIGNRGYRRKSDDEKTDEEIENAEKEKLTTEEIRELSLRRARNMITDLVYCNAWQWRKRNDKPYLPVFITFTFKENVTDLDYANKEFRNFIRRFSYSIRGKMTFLKYLSVVEFQERGAIHFHVVFFNLPFVDKIYDKVLKMWRDGVGEGSTYIESVYSNQGIVKYLSDYLTKSVEGGRLQARKSYFASKGLKKPIIINFEELVNLIKNKIPAELKGRPYEYESEFLKDVNGVEYNLVNNLEIVEFIHKEIVNKYLV